MLTIYLPAPTPTSNERTFSWHVGQPAPAGWHPSLARHVIELYADGHEAIEVLQRCHNLPTVNPTRPHRWFGDTAKFIAGNLFS